MAKIKLIYYRNRDKGISVDSHLEYQAAEKLGYTERPGKFFVRIPEGYTDFATAKEVQPYVSTWNSRGRQYIASTGKNEAEAEKNYKAYMDLYFASQTKETKVILFQHEGAKPDRDDSYYGRKVKLSFDYRVCTKKTIGTASKYFESFGANHTREVSVGGRYTENHWHEIPHTPEREAFLKSIRKGMVDLIDKFDNFIGGPDKILKSIESKQKLLNHFNG